ncbi:MAG TPA: hypothetical protein VFG76_06965 [Candidatus Polarisedimenticolia bacterium]|nr:hypothetical protein [Candidatus Polarisedimenticolia bacterium]
MIDLFLAALVLAQTLPGVPVDLSWGRDPIWDDGKAEVARYDAHRKVYGADRAFETRIITVKEDFNKTLGVKADPPYEGKDLLTVLKMNVISRIDTENYPYQYMTSLFVRREDPREVFKMTQSSQEWCGATFKEIVTWDGAPYMNYHSYFDGQGDGRTPITLGAGTYLEEQLLLVLRAAEMKEGVEYRFGLHAPLITNSVRGHEVREAVAKLSGEESLVTPAGTFTARRIEIAAPGSSAAPMTFWIEKGGRRALLKLSTADGRSLQLREISRRDYWSR